jgi:hypothetical protein
MNKVSYLPVWKEGATPHERFLELALIAQAHPERFQNVVVVYHEKMEDSKFRVRYITNGGSVLETLGLLELGKEKLLRWSLDGED